MGQNLLKLGLANVYFSRITFLRNLKPLNTHWANMTKYAVFYILRLLWF